MRPAIRFTYAFLVPTLLFMLLTQCNRSAGDADATTEGGAEASNSEAGRAMQLTDAGRERAGTTPPPARDGTTADTTGLSIDPRDAAFAAHRLSAAPRYPEDFVIGSLRTSGLSSALLAAREQGARLLRSLLQRPQPQPEGPAGEASYEDLLLDFGPGARSQLEEVIAAADAVGLAGGGVRLGRPERLTDEEVSIPFRVLGEEESLRGELVLEMADGRWYTADIQVTRSSMGSAGAFEPGLDGPRF